MNTTFDEVCQRSDGQFAVIAEVSGPGVPADGRAEFVQAPRGGGGGGVGGGGVVQLGQAVHPLQDHLQHVADLPQHAT